MGKNMCIVGWIERWYKSNCDGAWENDHGIIVHTLDNPGWWVKADLRKANRQTVPSDEVLVARGDLPCAENGNIGGDVWIKCEIVGGRFDGAGDPTQLVAILSYLRDVVEKW